MFSQVTAQRIEHRKLSEFTPYPRNPRHHSYAQIAQIAGSVADVRNTVTHSRGC
jgi:hypothetical protein